MSFISKDKSVAEVGVKDYDRRLFDCLVYMPHGTTYNSYFVKGGQFNALIDCSDPEMSDTLIAHLRQNHIDRIDFIVLLHAEQDHSGNIFDILALYPNAKVVCTEKVRQMMEIHLHLGSENMTVVKEGDELDLGGMKLTFYPIPFAHWPDNTMAHLMPQNILFSSDLFGAHNSEVDESSDMDASLIRSARSYFSEIMMPFRKNIAKYVALADRLAPAVIAPAHGAVYTRPEQILDFYRGWISDDVIRKVTIPYVSMHDSVRTAVDCLASELELRGIEVVKRSLGKDPSSLLIETGELIFDMVDAAAVIFAFPTVLGGPHPAIAYAAITANAMIPKTKFMGMMCAYAWATKAAETVDAITPNFKGQRFDPLLFKGLPTDDDIAKIRSYAGLIADAIERE
ncbi:MAG: FprA family A-type flavoprotein [Saccharofermentanales bacterium]